jgi:hypothetical protein
MTERNAGMLRVPPIVAQLSFCDRQDDVACLAEGGSDVLDDDNGPAHELAVQPAHGRLV